jgi:hypothetical protein
MARWTNVLENQSQTNIYFDEPTNACWFATIDGDLQQFRVLGQKFRRFGSGWQDAVAVLPSTDGLHLFLVVSGGDILVVKREDGERTQASVLLSTGVTLVAATRLLNNDLLVLDDVGQVYRVLFSAGTSYLFTAVAGANMLAADEASGELLLCVPDFTSQVYRFSLNDGSSVSEHWMLRRTLSRCVRRRRAKMVLSFVMIPAMFSSRTGRAQLILSHLIFRMYDLCLAGILW